MRYEAVKEGEIAFFYGIKRTGIVEGGIYNPVGVTVVTAQQPRTALRLSWASG